MKLKTTHKFIKTNNSIKNKDCKFKRLSTSTKHNHMRLDEKIFVCAYARCKYRTAQKTTLERHIKRYHTLRPQNTEVIDIAKLLIFLN